MYIHICVYKYREGHNGWMSMTYRFCASQVFHHAQYTDGRHRIAGIDENDTFSTRGRSGRHHHTQLRFACPYIIQVVGLLWEQEREKRDNETNVPESPYSSTTWPSLHPPSSNASIESHPNGMSRVRVDIFCMRVVPQTTGGAWCARTAS